MAALRDLREDTRVHAGQRLKVVEVARKVRSRAGIAPWGSKRRPFLPIHATALRDSSLVDTHRVDPRRTKRVETGAVASGSRGRYCPGNETSQHAAPLQVLPAGIDARMIGWGDAEAS